MTDSPSDPQSDDPSGSFLENSELFEFLDGYLRQLARTGLPAGSRPGEGGAAPDWAVEERADGTFAVRAEGAEAVAGAFADRSRAYLVAAALTAAGPDLGSTRAETDQVAEPAAAYGAPIADDPTHEPADEPIEHRKEMAARTIRGLLANPKAAELFLRAVDPEVLREALALRDAALEDQADEAN